MSIVVDNGTDTIKAGFAGDDAPRTIFRTIVGRPKIIANHDKLGNKDAYVGDGAESKNINDSVSLKSPIENKIIKNWDDMEKIWYHTFYNALRIEPKEHTILLTEPVLNPKVNREKMTKIMFETFNTPGMYIANTPGLSLFATGRTTGIAFESGCTMSQATALYSGMYYVHAYENTRLLAPPHITTKRCAVFAVLDILCMYLYLYVFN